MQLKILLDITFLYMKNYILFLHIFTDNGESLQILRYEIGQFYLPHSDYFNEKYSAENGGNRIATVLMYL